MNFLVDANLPPGLAAWLRDHGHNAGHVSDQPGVAADDAMILEFARQQGQVIVTKDEDFAALGTLNADSPAVVWLRLGNATPSSGTGSNRFCRKSCSDWEWERN